MSSSPEKNAPPLEKRIGDSYTTELPTLLDIEQMEYMEYVEIASDSTKYADLQIQLKTEATNQEVRDALLRALSETGIAHKEHSGTFDEQEGLSIAWTMEDPERVATIVASYRQKSKWLRVTINRGIARL